MHILRPSIFSRTDGPLSKGIHDCFDPRSWVGFFRIDRLARSFYSTYHPPDLSRRLFIWLAMIFWVFRTRLQKCIFQVLNSAPQISDKDLGLWNPKFEVGHHKYLIACVESFWNSFKSLFISSWVFLGCSTVPRITRSNVGPPIPLGIWSVSHFDGKIIDILWGIKL